MIHWTSLATMRTQSEFGHATTLAQVIEARDIGEHEKHPISIRWVMLGRPIARIWRQWVVRLALVVNAVESCDLGQKLGEFRMPLRIQGRFKERLEHVFHLLRKGLDKPKFSPHVVDARNLDQVSMID